MKFSNCKVSREFTCGISGSKETFSILSNCIINLEVSTFLGSFRNFSKYSISSLLVISFFLFESVGWSFSLWPSALLPVSLLLLIMAFSIWLDSASVCSSCLVFTIL
uniref:Uncharacterized protein n=1 Tax=Cacopsylla melanoneura TaxID=428564 RepID=A0A8D9DPN1_9HEMI